MQADAIELKRYMSELSERAYCAGWMAELEYSLWTAVLEGRLKYGRLQITRVHSDKLKELSDKCGGWIMWDETSGETFVSLEHWRELYDQKQAEVRS